MPMYYRLLTLLLLLLPARMRAQYPVPAAFSGLDGAVFQCRYNPWANESLQRGGLPQTYGGAGLVYERRLPVKWEALLPTLPLHLLRDTSLDLAVRIEPEVVLSNGLPGRYNGSLAFDFHQHLCLFTLGPGNGPGAPSFRLYALPDAFIKPIEQALQIPAHDPMPLPSWNIRDFALAELIRRCPSVSWLHLDLNFHHARAFLMNPQHGMALMYNHAPVGQEDFVDDHTPLMVLHPKRLHETGAISLDDTWALLINSVLKAEPESKNMCFEPHHGVVLYNVSNEPLLGLSICLQCSNLQINVMNETCNWSFGYAEKLYITQWLQAQGLPVLKDMKAYDEYFRQHEK